MNIQVEVRTGMEESKWISVKAVATELGVVRGTVYNYMRKLNIKTKKFPLDTHTYMSRASYAKIIAAKKAAEEEKH